MLKVSSVSELRAQPGLESAKRTVEGIVTRSAPVHAVLLFGEEGSGKSEVAGLLAQFWLCRTPGGDGPCGECQPCRTYQKGTAGDLLRVRPIGASSIIRLHALHRVEGQVPEGYENVIPIQEFLRTMPIAARNKVVWISEADRMNSDAAKAFLKTLEEPPPYAKFILTTTELGRVETTVRSRCMMVPMQLPTEEAWAEAVGEFEPWERTMANRSVGRLERIRSQREAFESLANLVEEMATMKPGGALAAAARFRKIIEVLQKGEESTSRASAADALRALGTLMSSHGFSPVCCQRVAQSHRRIVGNALAAYEFDALFSLILMENERMPANAAGQKH